MDHHTHSAGYRSSTYSSSSQQPFSAADAYAQYGSQPSPPPSSSQLPQHQQHQRALSSSRPAPSRNSGFTHRSGDIERRGVSDGDDDDDDDDSDEAWNVYDDFNNNSAAAATAASAAPTPSLHAGGDAGYYSHEKQSMDAMSTPGLTPFSDYPSAARGQRNSTLLTADAFGFDVQNADPRHHDASAAAGGPPLHSADSHHVPGHDPDKNESGIELITVPALGQEFTKEEMSQMRRPYKRKVKAARRKDRAARWGKGDYKIWGWLNPRIAVLLAFFSCILLGVTLFFVIPRVPTIAFLTTNPLQAVPDSSSMNTHYFPTNFSMTMNLNLRGDNTAGWIPSRASSMKVEVRELTTYKKIGEGTMNDMTFPGRGKKVFQLPVDFSYRSLNATGDATFLAVHDACRRQYPNTPRPNLTLGVKLSMNIAGLVGTKSSSTNINTACPFELQNDQ